MVCYSESMDFSTIGLSGRDRRVYEALLVEPQSSIRKVAEDTGINRGSVYESIKDLQSAGLVSYVEKGKLRKYTAADPEKLHEIVNEKRRELANSHSDIDNYVQSLASMTPTATQFRFASFYDGNEGVAAILRDVLGTCRTEKFDNYCSISSPRISGYMYENFPHFTRERIKQGLSVRVLRQGVPLRKLAEKAETRYMTTHQDTGTYTLIYGSKVAILNIDSTNQLHAIVIENKSVADSYRQLFEHAWESAAGSDSIAS